MKTTDYILYFVAALLGMLLHIFAVKIPGVVKSAKAANLKFSYSTYFMDDSAAIIASFICLFIYLMVLGELVAYQPYVLKFIIFLSVTVGFMGSSLWLSLIGRAQAKINSTIDIKTNLADEVSPPAADGTPK